MPKAGPLQFHWVPYDKQYQYTTHRGKSSHEQIFYRGFYGKSPEIWTFLEKGPKILCSTNEVFLFLSDNSVTMGNAWVTLASLVRASPNVFFFLSSSYFSISCTLSSEIGIVAELHIAGTIAELLIIGTVAELVLLPS